MALGDKATVVRSHEVRYGRNEFLGEAPALVTDPILDISLGFLGVQADVTTLSSSSPDDTAGGTGCRKVRVTGLDEEYNHAVEEVIMNGTALVPMNKKFRRIHSVEALLVGTDEFNVGLIDVRHDLQVISRMGVATNQATIAAFTVPAGHQGFIETFWGELEEPKSGDTLSFRLWTRRVGEARRLRFTLSPTSLATSFIRHIFAQTDDDRGFLVLQGEDVWVEGTGTDFPLIGNAGFEVHMRHRGVE